MSNTTKTRLPQFSLAGLFWFASAVAIGFAVGQKPRIDVSGFWLQGYQQAFYTPTLLAIASVLVIYELGRHALRFRSTSNRDELIAFALRLAVVARLVLGGGIVLVIVITQLINREILRLPDSEEFIQFYTEFWPATLLTLMLILAMRLMIVRRSVPVESIGKAWLVATVLAVGLLVIGLYVVVDRLLVTGLVHVAIDNVEKSHAMRWQRKGVFPNHQAEGYRSFWLAFNALIALLISGACLLATAFVHGRMLAAIWWLAFLGSVAYIANFVWWFAMIEFPRLNPDLAGERTATYWPDWLAGMLILLGLAFVVAHKLSVLATRTELPTDSHGINTPRVSGLMAIAAALIAFGCGTDSARVLYESLNGGLFWTVSESAWINRLAMLIQTLIVPEAIIPLAAAISGVTLIWQYYRPPADYGRLAALHGSHFLVYWVAASAWLLVAIPTFAIFGFCYWLGPWVL